MRFALFLLLGATMFGCKKSQPPVEAPPAVAEMPAAPAVQGADITGKVLERIDASSYSYLRLKVGEKEVWSAVPKTTFTVGQEVTVLRPMEMVNFESKTLNKTFPSIFFGTLKP